MKYILLDETGAFIGGYAPEVHGAKGADGSSVPDDAIEVSDEVWHELASNQQTRRYMDGQVVVHVPAPVVAPQPQAQPSLFASAGLTIQDGLLVGIELAAQLQGAIYEDGWLMVAFANPLDAAHYLVFAQTDVPAKIEQFKDGGSFELVFTDPVTGDPVEPGRIDLQILKVR